MRRIPNAQRIAEYDGLRQRVNQLEQALQLATVSTPDASETIRDDDGSTYTYALYGARMAHGGLVVLTFRSPVNRYPVVDLLGPLDTLDRQHHTISQQTQAVALDRLHVARYRLLNQAS